MLQGWGFPNPKGRDEAQFGFFALGDLVPALLRPHSHTHTRFNRNLVSYVVFVSSDNDLIFVKNIVLIFFLGGGGVVK